MCFNAQQIVLILFYILITQTTSNWEQKYLLLQHRNTGSQNKFFECCHCHQTLLTQHSVSKTTYAMMPTVSMQKN